MTKLVYESAEQNKTPIFEVIQRELCDCKSILEIASGTGQHCAHFALLLQDVEFQPSEKEKALLESIEAYNAPLPNVKKPLFLDVEETTWPKETFGAAININMIHIAPFTACVAMFRGFAGCVRQGGRVLLYGPFFEEGVKAVQSNLDFDISLKARDPRWGVRTVEAVRDVGENYGFRMLKKVEMPVNNLSLIFEMC